MFFSLPSTKSCGQLSVKVLCSQPFTKSPFLLHHCCFHHSELPKNIWSRLSSCVRMWRGNKSKQTVKCYFPVKRLKRRCMNVYLSNPRRLLLMLFLFEATPAPGWKAGICRRFQTDLLMCCYMFFRRCHEGSTDKTLHCDERELSTCKNVMLMLFFLKCTILNCNQSHLQKTYV